MDSKQKRIFKNILLENELPTNKKIRFKQYRNLKEFKYFQIERINPTHIIQLYGVLKNNNVKKKTSKTLINAGEIIIGMTTIAINMQILLLYTDLILLILSMYIINCFLFYWFGRFKPWLNIFNQWYDYAKTLIKKNHWNTPVA
jgi:hypothetical protein